MLDENLPTFRLKPSSDNPLASILYFTHNGSEPTPEYLLRRADPALHESRGKYAIALCDAHNADVVYGEVTVEPEWTQPTLSAAELRAQAQSGAGPAPAVAHVPDSFTIQLYNPDQSVAVKMVSGSWGKSDSWEFELPVQTFRTPTISEIDREQQNSSPAAADLVPRIMFRWKKDGLLSKDMTCYMSGTRLGARKNKEPDITIALFKAAREPILTVYQPNLHRVELEDRKGLELVLLLGSEVIRDLWLTPKSDLFNIQGAAGGAAANGNKRKNSRPVAATSSSTAAIAATAMSGALNPPGPPPQPAPSTFTPPSNRTNTSPPPPPPPASNQAAIDAETRRLQAMVEREQRERDKAERAEQKRIQRMIDEEAKERRRREAEVAKETERLRKVYGVAGQELPSDRPSLPPRGGGGGPPPQSAQYQPPLGPPPSHLNQNQQLGPGPWGYHHQPPPTLPPRPVSAGPQHPGPGPGPGYGPGQQQQQQQQQGPFHFNTLNTLWNGAAQHMSAPGRRGTAEEEEAGRNRVQKKRSSHW